MPKFPFQVKLCFLLSVAIVVNACKADSIKDAPIPVDSMVLVLTDLHLAESYSLGLGDSAKSKFDKNFDSLTGFYLSVYKHYRLDHKRFEEAMEWYRHNPAFVDSIYQRVQVRLDSLMVSYKITEPGKKESEQLNPDTTKAKEVVKPETGADTVREIAKPFTTGEEK